MSVNYQSDVRKKIFLKIYYSMLDWEWYSDTNTFRVFMHLLLTANRKDQPYKGDVIRRGDVLASQEFIAVQTGLGVQQVKTALKHLLSTNEVTKRKVGKVNVFTVVNYSKWQGESPFCEDESTAKKPEDNQEITKSQPETNQEVTTNQPITNREVTTPIDCKIEENEENERLRECESVAHAHAHGKLNNVFITDDEYKAFCRQYSFADAVIDELSVKIATGDPKYSTGHLGHLYVFANNYTERKAPAQPSYDIDTAMKRAYALDPTKTKRR